MAFRSLLDLHQTDSASKESHSSSVVWSESALSSPERKKKRSKRFLSDEELESSLGLLSPRVSDPLPSEKPSDHVNGSSSIQTPINEEGSPRENEPRSSFPSLEELVGNVVLFPELQSIDRTKTSSTSSVKHRSKSTREESEINHPKGLSALSGRNLDIRAATASLYRDLRSIVRRSHPDGMELNTSRSRSSKIKTHSNHLASSSCASLSAAHKFSVTNGNESILDRRSRRRLSSRQFSLSKNAASSTQVTNLKETSTMQQRCLPHSAGLDHRGKIIPFSLCERRHYRDFFADTHANVDPLSMDALAMIPAHDLSVEKEMVPLIPSQLVFESQSSLSRQRALIQRLRHCGEEVPNRIQRRHFEEFSAESNDLSPSRRWKRDPRVCGIFSYFVASSLYLVVLYSFFA